MKSKKNSSTKTIRLGRHILPKKYQIYIKPDLESATFSGEETITLKLSKPVKDITLHSRELEITSAEYETGEKLTFAGKVSYDKKAELAKLAFQKPLLSGQGKLKLTFRGSLNNQMRGYYLSKYTHKGEEKLLATTQFEAVDARMAFPCFDEPDLKSIFEVSLHIPTGHEAISNTVPISVQEHEGGYKTVRFSPTPKMSTYLLAFISGELEFLESKTKSGVTVKVYTPLSKKNQGKFALQTAVAMLEFFEKYFNIKYPLPSLDLIAVPDFASGAMENWGAITFRETALLIDENHSSLSRKQWVAMVIGHELAHQWFGNLVTMDWWTHLWLNEGFASYIEYLAVDHLFPKWHIWTQFLSMDFDRGITKDGLLSTHPIEVDVHDPGEIDEIFDDISYRKGSSVIRMLANYLGQRDFRLGLEAYLKKHKYKNASTDQLWESLGKVSKKPVKTLMSNWTRQAGFPLISAVFKEHSIALSQQRFFRNPKAKEKTKTRWPVPVMYELKGKRTSFLMEKDSSSLPLSAKIPVVKLNAGETGFYVVNYEKAHWPKLIKAVKDGSLSAEDRFGVASSLWSLTEAGFMSTDTALEYSTAFRRETEVSVWQQILSGVLQAKRLFGQDTKSKKSFENYIQLLLEPTKKRLGFDQIKGESHNDSLLRPLVIKTLGTNGDIPTQEKALQILTKTLRQGAVPVHIRSAVYAIVAHVGDRPEYTYFKNLYLKTDNHEEKERLASALCGFTKSGLLETSLKFSLSEQVRKQDATSFIRFTTVKPGQAELAWKFVEQHWNKYKKLYGHGGRNLNSIVSALQFVTDDTAYKQMTKFFKLNSQVGLERTAEQTLEVVNINLQWKNRDKEAVTEYIKRFS